VHPQIDPTKNKSLKTKILLVEDDKNIAITLIEYFETLNFNIYWASDGLEGLKMIKKIKPEIILCDLMMPKLSGDELLNTIKNTTEFKNIPFLFITANTSIESKLIQLQMGAIDYIIKPFQFEELFYKINNLIKFRKELMIEKKQLKFQILKSDFKTFEEQLDAFLIKRVSEKFDIAQLAEYLNMSSSTLDKNIRKKFDVNISTYIREFRLEYAKSLIKKGMENISELSDKSGFNSSSYFSTCFKKYTSKSPRQYIKKIKKSNLF